MDVTISRGALLDLLTRAGAIADPATGFISGRTIANASRNALDSMSA